MCVPRSQKGRMGDNSCARRPVLSCACIPSPVSASRHAFSATTVRKPQSPISQTLCARPSYLRYVLIPFYSSCHFHMIAGRNLPEKASLIHCPSTG